MTEQEVAVRLENHENRICGAEHRIKDLESIPSQVNELTISIKELAIFIENMTKTQEKQETRLTAIEQKPAKRWEDIAMTVIRYAVTAVLAFAVAKLL